MHRNSIRNRIEPQNSWRSEITVCIWFFEVAIIAVISKSGSKILEANNVGLLLDSNYQRLWPTIVFINHARAKLLMKYEINAKRSSGFKKIIQWNIAL